ncbi:MULTISPECIES: scytonemin biosynthesis protein ScyA [unclassified Nodularia (in: cyanobacteria)]|uniref:scytonemin biosynthesis protein ScyA n=1 Tax=unclassified Nodularia (in: cyanobacteria) TaxID=2656917 RepID=UPI00187FB456|nr:MULTISPECIES: scytonemin biosynthesis protein ScyA [unclassified Nodularia (in: cyanobacteria)]MBE9200933.1 scytonemin biosynthesis protein ScyA [Nodularia sp. LEGE 06071]MCC2692481.1 scytonemin biosynthesis protein ScyA [Nodularia sp. LEGE 04288]
MSQNYSDSNSPPITSELYKKLPPNSFVESSSNGSQQLDKIASKPEIQPFLVNESPQVSVAHAIAQMLENLGVGYAFGVAGGAMASLWNALSNSNIEVLNFRHEAGAAFAASEAYFASDRPTVVFTTAGPGITNALTGLFAARGEGAKVILLSACTSAPQRGRWAIQETSSYTLPSGGIFTPGALFNYAITIESAAQLPQIFRKIALGLAQPGGFVVHLSIPTAIQTSLIDHISLPQLEVPSFPMTSQGEAIAKSVELLSAGNFAIWVGFGARHAAEEIRQFAEKTGAAVMCSPRAKGIFPEDHPQFVGVTGLGGHASVLTYMEQQPPTRTLVLGTRLGEPTSFWNKAMVPPRGFIHVDIDPEVPGVAYSDAETFPIQSDIKAYMQELLQHWPDIPPCSRDISLPHPERPVIAPPANIDYPVRPFVLMAAIQKIIVEGSDAVVMAECGNSFTWSTHFLRFAQTNRYRVSTGVGAMGHTATGVLGAAQVRNGKAVAIVGDGAMLMNNEISTAVKYNIPAVWIVLNDARYNMCHQGMKMLGLKGADAEMPETNFAMIARGMGAEAVGVVRESDLEAALEQAIAAKVPFLVDVVIDADQPAPSGGRNKSLAAQGVKSNQVNGSPKPASFPSV